MSAKPVLIVGEGHLAARIRQHAAARGHQLVSLPETPRRGAGGARPTFESLVEALRGIDLRSLRAIYLVDEQDEDNLALLIALLESGASVPVVISFFNENIAPHLKAANPQVCVINPARIAAPAFIEALATPVTRKVRYAAVAMADRSAPARKDHLIRRLLLAFGTVLVAAAIYFHFAEPLSWLDAMYFVIVTVATVGYGDITLLHSSTLSKLLGIALILSSTVFIWMIFSLTVDEILKRRVQRALGRKRYSHSGHVILCGLGRLGTFIAEGLLARGERVVIVEANPDAPAVDQLRARGADVYIGDGRRPAVLQDVGAARAKAVYAVVDDDLVNLEVGLNARSFAPGVRLILRIFDQSMCAGIRDNFDIHLTLSMSAIADEQFWSAVGASEQLAV